MDAENFMKSALPLTAVVLGILMLLTSLLWGYLFPPSRTWTEEKSLRLSELGSETNGLKFALVESRQRVSMHAGKNPGEIKEAYDKARAEYDLLFDEFENAKEGPKVIASTLRWIGIGLALIGGVAHLAGQRE
jgi:hypothetical protein